MRGDHVERDVTEAADAQIAPDASTLTNGLHHRQPDARNRLSPQVVSRVKVYARRTSRLPIRWQYSQLYSITHSHGDHHAIEISTQEGQEWQDLLQPAGHEWGNHHDEPNVREQRNRQEGHRVGSDERGQSRAV